MAAATLPPSAGVPKRGGAERRASNRPRSACPGRNHRRLARDRQDLGSAALGPRGAPCLLAALRVGVLVGEKPLLPRQPRTCREARRRPSPLPSVESRTQPARLRTLTRLSHLLPPPPLSPTSGASVEQRPLPPCQTRRALINIWPRGRPRWTVIRMIASPAEGPTNPLLSVPTHWGHQ